MKIWLQTNVPKRYGTSRPCNRWSCPVSAFAYLFCRHDAIMYFLSTSRVSPRAISTQSILRGDEFVDPFARKRFRKIVDASRDRSKEQQGQVTEIWKSVGNQRAKGRSRFPVYFQLAERVHVQMIRVESEVIRRTSLWHECVSSRWRGDVW